MDNVNPSMCLKVKKDLFIYPEKNRGVYLRNNVTSVRMEGSTIEKWLERLIPMLDGSLTLAEITNGLPEPYQEQVYKITDVLFKNGFVRDVSQDLPHELPDLILKKYASQIEYINHVKDSGAHRFQAYRKTKAAVIGSGPLLYSFVRALIDSGLPAFHIFPTQKTDEKRLKKLIEEAKSTDPATNISITPLKNEENMQPFECIIYGSNGDDLDQLRATHDFCKKQGKLFLPVTIDKRAAFAGPMVSIESKACWESAYRRLQHKENHSPSSTAISMLANVAVFELFKTITGVQDKNEDSLIYRLNVDTLEGSWHPVLPHPHVAKTIHAAPLPDPLLHMMDTTKPQKDFQSLFYQITSRETGIFHTWEEEDLRQLPLSQCKVTVADPHIEIVCSGITHDEARTEAGLSGLETYVKGLYREIMPSLGVGAGQTAVEGMCRALQNHLHETFVKIKKYAALSKLDVNAVQDERCHFLLQSLSACCPGTKLYRGADELGFPVIWVQTDHYWYGSVGLNTKTAVERALKTALIDIQNIDNPFNPYGIKVHSVPIQAKTDNLTFTDQSPQKTFTLALETLKKNNVRAEFFLLQAETILAEHTAGIFGVTLCEEGQT
ncbi:bacteriocin maturation protein [Fictibacillus phosphorivorans]|uniref:bacteriocin maturation protein n=1 Tax=Fictibacillus phosphorivorans TaxID=1221500 RepID=UPI00203E78A5|nr:bacteriocin maturation protein [Fictibacillus phosphorivorans]MCM3718155.1 bacteriocin maturation protein [Fictibacillus phosphorivorans]MCM3775782.1 bacteriocin maturation protein [Fictibacillus phosphorivorans]